MVRTGLLAWSSERQPEQVFTLLEAIFQSFDRLARKRSVFKVETIGDCYVAVTGLPDPQPVSHIVLVFYQFSKAHAIDCSNFPRRCL